MQGETKKRGQMAEAPARWMAVALAMVCAVAWLPRTEWVWHVCAGCVVSAVLVAMRVKAGRLLRSLSVMLPVSAGMALFALFQEHGVAAFCVLVMKGMLCLALVCGLMQRFSFMELLGVLERARLPRPLVTTLALLERYRFVLQDELHRLLWARRCRQLTTEPLGWHARSAVLGRLFGRSVVRAENVYRAMGARGWRS